VIYGHPVQQELAILLFADGVRIIVHEVGVTSKAAKADWY
jgi:hypothetical protein